MRKVCLSLLVMAMCLTFVMSMSAATNEATDKQVSKPYFTTTPPLRDLIKNQQDLPFGYHQASPVLYPKAAQRLANQKSNFAAQKDPLAASGYNAPDSVPAKVLDWLGVGIGFFGYSVPDAPTDGQISIGSTQIVQWVNVQFAVFDLNGNNLLFNGQHFANGNVLWTSGPCASTNSGDIIVQWDKVASRWIMYQPRFSAPYQDCFAVSQTSDFLGSWYRTNSPPSTTTLTSRITRRSAFGRTATTFPTTTSRTWQTMPAPCLAPMTA